MDIKKLKKKNVYRSASTRIFLYVDTYTHGYYNDTCSTVIVAHILYGGETRGNVLDAHTLPCVQRT
jgi:hypothetical protein